ncbi:MAG: TlpA family protein disulfide reductase [Patiriisocius sp.]|uniref:TlpA family protein disulfide reductase n=1 Tax=Patiriisocius sp. TaxID=2822396 RepID=UPI003EF3C99E
MKNTQQFLMRCMLFSFLIILTIACKNKTKETTDTQAQTEEISEEQQINTLVDDPENQGDKMLLGLVNQEGFKNKGLFPWMYEEFESYKPEPSIFDELRKQLDDVTIKVFMGTWCEDSQREIPRLYKILHIADYDLSGMEIIAVSHDKDTPSGFEKGLDIEYVPTIIFYRNGKELGRFVEYAQENLEKDMLTILKGDPYKHAYQE